MTVREAKKILQSDLCPMLQSLDFIEHAPLLFARDRENRSEILNFGGRLDRGLLKFNFVAGVRFPAVEAILRPDNDDPTYPTISAPIHFLHPDRQYFEWEFADETDLVPVLKSVRAEIENSANKFFKHFASLGVVEHDLRLGPTGADWHMLGREQITEVLAAIATLDGRIHHAQQIINNALADPRNNKPAKQRRLERLKVLLEGTEWCQDPEL